MASGKYTKPQPGLYLMQPWVMAAMDSCFALIEAHRHGRAFEPMNGQSHEA